jgi:ATP-dependent exoDNAse (exonuclease V) alpha subunit
VEEALGSERIVALYHENGDRAELYTTSEVREEELKILRLSGYIHAKANGPASMGDKIMVKVEDLIKKDQTLNEQQRGALSHLLLAQEGLRVLKGRAGTGKSHVLGKVVSISNDLGVEIIGLAPTHKAKQELGRVGYERCDTIRGFLFKLHNGRVDLVSGSLLVVDEAGMVGNDDFQELLRVAASNKCNVILAGDERQLSSVQRGGMFEVFADKYGCYEMSEIRRQESEWGRSVASAFSKGNVKDGVEILANNNRIISRGSKVDSMEALLRDWNSSAVDVQHRLIMIWLYFSGQLV